MFGVILSMLFVVVVIILWWLITFRISSSSSSSSIEPFFEQHQLFTSGNGHQFKAFHANGTPPPPPPPAVVAATPAPAAACTPPPPPEYSLWLEEGVMSDAACRASCIAANEKDAGDKPSMCDTCAGTFYNESIHV